MLCSEYVLVIAINQLFSIIIQYLYFVKNI